MVEENSAKNILVNRHLKPLDTIHIPQGLIHFSHNPNCEPAAFLANFGTTDPGTQTTWNSFIQIPTHIIHAATGALAEISSLTANAVGNRGNCLQLEAFSQEVARAFDFHGAPPA